ncbi:MAG TPA: alpha/beta hydrolase [Polyangiaceae bacterium]|nr:alpha/beta hydrolase [Polyangiaceae bacterium]
MNELLSPSADAASSASPVSSARPAPSASSSPNAPDARAVLAALAAGPQRMLDVGHSRLAHWSFGRGPDVVFVHGWPLHSATFRKLVPRLAGDFTCHLIDLPSVGRSESGPNVPSGLLDHAASLRAAVDALGLSRYAFLAHDSGGYFARIVAAADPRVAGLVLGNTEIPGHESPGVTFVAGLARLPGGGAALRTALRSAAVRRSPFGFGGCFEDARSVEGEFGDLFVRPLLESSAAFEGQLRLLRQLDPRLIDRLPEAHGRLQAPSLLIWGRRDPFFPIAKARAMMSQFGGGAVLCEIPRAKLFAHEDHPEAFAGHALPFLKACFEPARAGAQALKRPLVMHPRRRALGQLPGGRSTPNARMRL